MRKKNIYEDYKKMLYLDKYDIHICALGNLFLLKHF